MKRLIFDLDGTLCWADNQDYENATPNLKVIEKLRQYQKEGYEIVICTSRNMRTYHGSIGKINANTLPIILHWLAKHNVPYDEIYTAKPWCGFEGFYIDDKAIRPDEFINLSYDEICSLVGRKI
jgi:capsule biosynthesis phosphatase